MTNSTKPVLLWKRFLVTSLKNDKKKPKSYTYNIKMSSVQKRYITFLVPLFSFKMTSYETLCFCNFDCPIPIYPFPFEITHISMFIVLYIHFSVTYSSCHRVRHGWIFNEYSCNNNLYGVNKYFIVVCEFKSKIFAEIAGSFSLFEMLDYLQ